MPLGFKPFWRSSKKTVKPPTISDLNAEELRKERLTLENEERRLVNEIAKVQHGRSLALAEYHAARENGEDTQAKLVARRMKNIDDQLRGLDFRHNALNKQQRMTSGMIVLKENEEFIARISGDSRINEMDLVDLQDWIQQATEDGELTMDRLEHMIGTMDNSFDSSSVSSDNSMDMYMASLDNEMPMTSTSTVAASRALDESIDASIEQVDQNISRIEKTAQEPMA